jgi:ABC-2 type transport system ATP-binding protein
MEIIRVEDLKKVFQVPKRRQGFLNSFKDLVKREWDYVTALQDINLSIQEGEVVGYIGPNGAGKSTTLKIMSGVLYPTSGSVVVDKIVPYQNKISNAKKITLIAGQRSNLYWDLPIVDTFELMKRIYKIPASTYERNLRMFCDILGIGDLLDTPTRQLSLGQRMRADFVAAMLHDPRIIYLDEPSIGLDVVAKDHIRDFIRQINRERGATIIITSHDIADIERICSRVIVIDHGEIVYSGSIDRLKAIYSNHHCVLNVKLDDHAGCPCIDDLKIEKNGDMICVSFDRAEYTPSAILYKLLERNLKIMDFTLIEPSLEDTVKIIYNERS